ncbi:MAG: glycosyltransferase family 39 protein [Candidatus Aureabacteria bacterium]|nr:glycosyltransferase family 39 protein [Candidatus Auribacterota bacterium]
MTERSTRLLICLLLALCALQAVASMRQQSMVTDEIVTFLPGYAELTTGNFRLTYEHPPLSKYIAAIPLLFLKPDLPLDHPAWREANSPALGLHFLYHNRVDAERIIFWGRMGIVACGCLLGFLVYLWASLLFGKLSGVMALFLYCFCPNILAHAGVATSDMAAACFIFLAVFSLWCFCRRPNWPGLLLVATCLALAQLSKFSAFLLFPIYVILYCAAYLSPAAFSALRAFVQADCPPRVLPARILSAVTPLIVVFCCAAVVIWAAYGFETAPLASLIGELPRRAARLLPPRLLGLPCPAPSFVRGLLFQLRHAAEGHPAFLMGRYSTTGWWYYFPVAFLIKTPVAILILFVLSLALFKRARADWGSECFVVLPPLLFFTACMLGKINIGLRYILPIYPFLFVFISRLAMPAPERRKLLAPVMCLLLAWHLASSLSIYPHYLAYFNELIGGPSQGYRYLVDSNLDWGQDVKGLKNYLREKGIDRIWECGFYPDVLDYYAIKHAPLPANVEGVSGYVAISAMDLQCVRRDDKHALDWLKERRPAAQVGHSIFVYAVDTPPTSIGTDHAPTR